MLKMLVNAKTNKEDVMLTLVFYVVIIAGIKFLLDGVEFTFQGHLVNLGHTDGGVYAAFLTPILGAHGYIDSKVQHLQQKVDNPNEPNN